MTPFPFFGVFIKESTVLSFPLWTLLCAVFLQAPAPLQASLPLRCPASLPPSGSTASVPSPLKAMDSPQLSPSTATAFTLTQVSFSRCHLTMSISGKVQVKKKRACCKFHNYVSHCVKCVGVVYWLLYVAVLPEGAHTAASFRNTIIS